MARGRGYPTDYVRHAPHADGAPGHALCGRTLAWRYKVSTPEQVAAPGWRAIGCEQCKARLAPPPPARCPYLRDGGTFQFRYQCDKLAAHDGPHRWAQTWSEADAIAAGRKADQ